jgi:hypothetical protein
MPETTTGRMELVETTGPSTFRCALLCECGAHRPGETLQTVTKGATETWPCPRCKKTVVMIINR